MNPAYNKKKKQQQQEISLFLFKSHSLTTHVIYTFSVLMNNLNCSTPVLRKERGKELKEWRQRETHIRDKRGKNLPWDNVTGHVFYSTPGRLITSLMRKKIFRRVLITGLDSENESDTHSLFYVINGYSDISVSPIHSFVTILLPRLHSWSLSPLSYDRPFLFIRLFNFT